MKLRESLGLKLRKIEMNQVETDFQKLWMKIMKATSGRGEDVFSVEGVFHPEAIKKAMENQRPLKKHYLEVDEDGDMLVHEKDERDF